MRQVIREYRQHYEDVEDGPVNDGQVTFLLPAFKSFAQSGNINLLLLRLEAWQV